jgi:ribosomal protein S1
MSDVDRWAEIKESLPVGSIVSCVVTRHAPFGVFAEISGVPFDGLIQITDFKDAGRMTPVEFPSIGSNLEAAVLGFKETGRQIWLGVKPSQIQSAKGLQRKDAPGRTTPAIARD